MEWFNTELALALVIYGFIAAVAVSCDTTPPHMETVNVYGEE